MIVIACDPGKMTGYAVWNDGGLQQAGQCELYEFQAWADETVRLHAAWGLELVCEDFRITVATAQKASDAHWAFGGIELLRYLGRRHEVPFTLQAPAQAKRFCGDDKLKRLGWYDSTPGGHRNDACRHLVVYLVNHALLPLSAIA